MDTSEMADVTLPVEFLCDDCESRCLLEVETCRRDEIARSQEVGQFGTNVEIDFGQYFLKIFFCEDDQYPFNTERLLSYCR
jgi:hypothetical protein